MIYDVVIIGSGVAGLYTALNLPRKLKIALIVKIDLLSGSTMFAQGGIAVVLNEGDTIEKHIHDTLEAGKGLCNKEAVKILAAEGPKSILDLINRGLKFDTTSEGKLSFTKEAAHSENRILHLGGDATGLKLQQFLIGQVKKCSNVSIFENCLVSELEMDRDTEIRGNDFSKTEKNTNQQRMQSAAASNSLNQGDLRNNGNTNNFTIKNLQRKTENLIYCKFITKIENSEFSNKIFSKFAVIASGGSGQVFLHTTNPAVSTGNGILLAKNSGLEIENMEFYQFHPTALDSEKINSNQNQIISPKAEKSIFCHDFSEPNNLKIKKQREQFIKIQKSESSVLFPQDFLISEAVRGEGAKLIDERGSRFMQKYDSKMELATRDVVARSIWSESLNGKAKKSQVYLDISFKNKDYLAARFPTIFKHCLELRLDISQNPIPIRPSAHYQIGGIKTDLNGRTSNQQIFAVGEVASTGVHGANRLASNSLLEALVFAKRTAEEIDKQIENTLFSSFAKSQKMQPLPSLNSVEIQNLHSLIKAVQKILWQNAGIIRRRENLFSAVERLNQLKIENTSLLSKPNILAVEAQSLVETGIAILEAAAKRTKSVGSHFLEN